MVVVEVRDEVRMTAFICKLLSTAKYARLMPCLFPGMVRVFTLTEVIYRLDFATQFPLLDLLDVIDGCVACVGSLQPQGPGNTGSKSRDKRPVFWHEMKSYRGLFGAWSLT